MPFNAPSPILVDSIVYVLDPENTATQYRARVLRIDAQTADLLLYPNADVEPIWSTVQEVYKVPSIPKETLMRIPAPGATVVGYQKVLMSANIEAPGWKAENGDRYGASGDMVEAAPVAAAIVPSGPGTGVADAKVPARTAGDGKFGVTFKPSLPPAANPKDALAAQHTRAREAEASDAAAQGSLPPLGYEPAVGMELQVGENKNHPFWSQHAVKLVEVMNISDSDQGPMLDVRMDGMEYPDILATRFMIPPLGASYQAEQHPPAGTVAKGALGINEHGVDKDSVVALVGQLVSVRLTSSDSIFNATLEAADAFGITLVAGQVKPSWNAVLQCKQLHFSDIPGSPPPKKTAEEKAADKAAEKAVKDAEKEAEKEAKAAAKELAKQEKDGAQQVITPAAPFDPVGALHEALAITKTILGGTKVSRKQVEAILPFLEVAVSAAPNHRGEYTTVQIEHATSKAYDAGYEAASIALQPEKPTGWVTGDAQGEPTGNTSYATGYADGQQSVKDRIQSLIATMEGGA